MYNPFSKKGSEDRRPVGRPPKMKGAVSPPPVPVKDEVFGNEEDENMEDEMEEVNDERDEIVSDKPVVRVKTHDERRSQSVVKKPSVDLQYYELRDVPVQTEHVAFNPTTGEAKNALELLIDIKNDLTEIKKDLRG